MFGSCFFHWLLACGEKEFLKYSVLQGNTCFWEFLICQSKLRIWLDGCKEFIEQTQSPHPSSLLEVLKPHFLKQLTTKGALNGSCYYYCLVVLHIFNFVWKIRWFCQVCCGFSLFAAIKYFNPLMPSVHKIINANATRFLMCARLSCGHEALKINERFD